MTINYSMKMATRFGINSALIASHLYDVRKTEGKVHQKKTWVRCSQKTLTAVFPFLGKSAVANALKRLTNHGILLKCEYNDSRFDHTLSYSFTDYGKAMMEEKDG